MKTMNLEPRALGPKGIQDFWQDFSSDDFSMPRVTIGMGSPMKGKLGHFNFSTGESLLELNGVSLLGRTNGQILYGGLGTVPPRCASDDGLNPASRIEQKVTEVKDGGCNACYARSWGVDARKDAIQASLGLPLPDEKPICQSTISLLMADKAGMPFVLLTKTHNLRVVKQFLFTGLRMRSIAHNVHAFGMAFDMSLRAMPGLGNRHELLIGNWHKLDGKPLSARQSLYETLGRKTREIVTYQHNKQSDLDEMGF